MAHKKKECCDSITSIHQIKKEKKEKKEKKKKHSERRKNSRNLIEVISISMSMMEWTAIRIISRLTAQKKKPTGEGGTKRKYQKQIKTKKKIK